jgi:hypothetical protein
MEYRLNQDVSWSGWWAVLEGTGGDDFAAVAWFRRREDAEMWALEKEEDQKRG